MRTQLVLIDYENVQPDLLPALKADHVHVRVFVGPLQVKLPIEFVLAMQELGDRAKFVRVNKQGKEALDLHLAFYMGCLSHEFSGAYFHVVSKDQGFLPLVEHLNASGANARLVESLTHIGPNGAAVAAPVLTVVSSNLDDQVAQARAWISSRADSKPASRKTLLSSLEKTAFTRQLDEIAVEKVMNKLVDMGVLAFNETGRVVYLDGLNG